MATSILRNLILIFSIYSTIGLRVRTDPTPENYSPQAYQQQLTSLQLKLTKSLEKIQKLTQSIDQAIQNEDSNDEKVASLTQGLADERDQLYQIQQFLKLPFDERLCQPAITQIETRDNFNKKLEDISDSLSELKNVWQKCKKQTCPRYEEFLKAISQEENYVQVIKENVNSKCKREPYKFIEENPKGLVDISSNLKKDNLKAENWFYGSLSPQQYQLKRFQLSTKYNLTSCPLQTPFVSPDDPNKCFQCSQKEALFSFQLRKCIVCDGLFFVNTSTSECQKCPDHQFYNFEEKKCQRCQKGQFLNEKTIECQFCEKNQKFNQETYECQNCEEEKYFDLEAFQCVTCNLKGGQFLNKTNFECQLCESWQFYNLDMKTCVDCPFAKYYNRTQGTCAQCPTQTQFNVTTGLCEKCEETQFYDSKSNQCYPCPLNEKYDLITESCVKAYQGEFPVGSICPQNQPYYIEALKACKKCPNGHYYSQEERRCLLNNNISLCPPDRPHYNPKTLSCEKSE